MVLGWVAPAAAQFTYNPPGQLTPGSGTGRNDPTVYVPGMRFPMENAPAYLNSQVWGRGGSQGPGGGQCDSQNYSYPWWDNYCEDRTWSMPMCPSGTGHQGQDIRAATCEKSRHWTVAATAGTITNIGSYSVSLTRSDGTRFRYLHVDMGQLAISNGQSVQRGDRIGLVSNDFGGTATTIHLHFDIQQNVSGYGTVYAPTYTSLIASYQELLGGTGTGGTGGAAGAPGIGGTAGTGVGGTGVGGTGAGTGGAGLGGSAGAGSGGDATGGTGASGTGAGGSGGSAQGGSGPVPPPPNGCTLAPDCDRCVSCIDTCLCLTNDWSGCVASCEPSTGGGAGTSAAGADPGGTGAAAATPRGRTVSDDGGCACSAPGQRQNHGSAGLALALALTLVRRRAKMP